MKIFHHVEGTAVAAGAGDLSVVKKLADTALNINCQEPQLGFTPFNYASQEGRVSVVQFLLTLPTVDITKPQKDGATPFLLFLFLNNHNR